MKKLIYTAFVICGMLTASCSDLLNLESKTDVTNNYLFTTPRRVEYCRYRIVFPGT